MSNINQTHMTTTAERKLIVEGLQRLDQGTQLAIENIEERSARCCSAMMERGSSSDFDKFEETLDQLNKEADELRWKRVKINGLIHQYDN